jgi:hypothetical protein
MWNATCWVNISIYVKCYLLGEHQNLYRMLPVGLTQEFLQNATCLFNVRIYA